MSTPLKNWLTQPRRSALVGACIFILALGIRLIGVTWALPNEDHRYSLHPDEPVNFLVSQNISVGHGEFDPGFYNYGTLYLTLLSISGDIIRGYVGPVEPQFEESVAIYTARVHLAGRLINCVSGAIIALLAYLVLIRTGSLLGAAIGGLSMAFAPALVVHSRFQTVDVFAAMLLSASIFYSLKFAAPHEAPLDPKIALKWTLLAGLFAGLSAGTKYNGILCIVAFFVATFDRTQMIEWAKRCLIASFTAIIAFFASTPGALLNPSKFWQDFGYEVRHASTGHGLVFEGLGGGFGVQMSHLVVGFGLIGFPLMVAGAIALGANRNREAATILSFNLLFLFLIGSAQVLFLRYTFPLYFGMAIGLGRLVDWNITQKPWKQMIAVATIVGVGNLAMISARWTSYMVTDDPRTIAASYLRSVSQGNWRTSAGLVSDPWFYTPPFYANSAAPRYRPFDLRHQEMKLSRSPVLFRYLPDDPNQRIDWDVRLLTERKPDYVTYSSFEFDDIDRISKSSSIRPDLQPLVDNFQKFQTQLQADYELKLFIGEGIAGVHDLEYIRPKMWVWKRKAQP